QISAVGIARDSIDDRPASKGPGGLLDVILTVVELAVHTNAEREQLQQLPPPVFVDGPLMAHAVVQVVDHGRVDGEFHQQVMKTPYPLVAKQIKLYALLSVILALGVTGTQAA